MPGLDVWHGGLSAKGFCVIILNTGKQKTKNNAIGNAIGGGLILNTGKRKTNNNAIGGQILNIGHSNKLQTHKDMLLHVIILNTGKQKTKNNAIGNGIGGLILNTGKQKTNSNAIGGRILNIGHSNKLQTQKDMLLHVWIRNIGNTKMSNNAICGRILNIGHVKMSNDATEGHQRQSGGHMTWRAHTKMVNSALVSHVETGTYRVFTVADTFTFQVQPWGRGRSVVQMAACQLTAKIVTANCLPNLN